MLSYWMKTTLKSLSWTSFDLGIFLIFSCSENLNLSQRDFLNAASWMTDLHLLTIDAGLGAVKEHEGLSVVWF